MSYVAQLVRFEAKLTEVRSGCATLQVDEEAASSGSSTSCCSAMTLAMTLAFLLHPALAWITSGLLMRLGAGQLQRRNDLLPSSSSSSSS